MRKYEKLVTSIIKYLGGYENIKSSSHCTTRLRFNLHNYDIVELNQIAKLDGVIGARNQSGQIQVIIGNKVAAVYEEVATQLKVIEANPQAFVTKNRKTWKQILSFDTLIDFISSLFVPAIGVLSAAGIFLGLVTILTSTKALDPASNEATVLNLIGNCVINMLPVIIAYSVAKKIDANVPTAIAIVGVLVSPTMITLASGNTELTFLGMPIKLISYAGALFPAIFAVFAQKYMKKLLDLFIPSVVRFLFVPLITIIILIPVTMIAFGPLGYYIGQGIGWLFTTIGSWQPWLVGGLVGGLWPVLVMFGMHYALFPIVFELLNSGVGGDYFIPASTASIMGQAGVTLAAFFLIKNKEEKQIVGSAAISALLGVTEPSLYSTVVKRKIQLFGVMLSGFIFGALAVGLGGRNYAFVPGGFLSLPAMYNPDNIQGFIAIVACGIASYIFGFLFTLAFTLEKSENIKTTFKDIKWWKINKLCGLWYAIKKDNLTQNKILSNKRKSAYVITTISKGEIDDLESTELPYLSDKQGYAIKLKNNIIYSPIDGKVIRISDDKKQIEIENKKLGIRIEINLDSLAQSLNSKDIICESKVGQEIEKTKPLLTIDKKAFSKNKEGVIACVILLSQNEVENFFVKDIISKNKKAIYVYAK